MTSGADTELEQKFGLLRLALEHGERLSNLSSICDHFDSAHSI